MVKRFLRLTLTWTLPLLMAACATESKRNEAELAQLLTWLPGEYDNGEQGKDDLRLGRDPHPALTLVIVPVYAPLMGRHVFYLQESAADDARRVIAQRLISFDIGKTGAVETLWAPAEPDRWRDAQLNPDLFKSLMPEDFKPLMGCELTWTQKDKGKGKDAMFTGANQPARCIIASHGGGTQRARVEMRAELTADHLALAEQSFDSAGKLVQGDAAEPFYRFRKH